MIKPILEKVFLMDKKERLARVCTLAVKQKTGIINPFEIIELSAIQTIREQNGECDKVRREYISNKT